MLTFLNGAQTMAREDGLFTFFKVHFPGSKTAQPFSKTVELEVNHKFSSVSYFQCNKQFSAFETR
jgi:hypothetical protein